MRHIYSTYKEHYKALIFLGLPIVIGQIGVIVLGFADTLMIGHHSTIELGAASFVNNVFNLAIIFSTGFSYGLTPIVGGLYGTHQYAPAGQALRNSLLANLMVALLLTICMTVLYLNIEHLGQPEELIPLIKPYYLVLLASLVFVMLFNGFKQFTDGITDTQTAMWILLGGNVLNIIGNYILIYGKLGLPELGLLGAGISTLFSRIVMVIVFIIIFMRSPRFVRYKIGFFRLGWSRAVFGRLNGLGWPIAFQMGMETASFSLSAIMIGWLGTIALASHQVMLAISQFTFMMYYGMGAASCRCRRWLCSKRRPSGMRSGIPAYDLPRRSICAGERSPEAAIIPARKSRGIRTAARIACRPAAVWSAGPHGPAAAAALPCSAYGG